MTSPANGPPTRSGLRARTAVELLLIATFVACYYAPFVSRDGLPSGDFGAVVQVSEIDDLVRRPFSIATWDPYTMCGRPTLSYFSVFEPLELPFRHLEPVTRMKALLVLFHVLSGLSMYGLVRDSGTNRGAALFAGLIFPIMTSHVFRSLKGHVQVPMLYALLPLAMLAFFRLRWPSARSVAVLGVALTLCLIRDPQRTLLAVAALGLGLLIFTSAEVLTAGSRGGRIRDVDGPRLITLALMAFIVAVALNSFELINGYVGDPYVGGWSDGEQEFYIDNYSLNNLFSLFDRDAVVGAQLEPLEIGFYASSSRYVGLSLVALVVIGMLDVTGLAPYRRRFWLSLAFMASSLWLSFGETPPARAIVDRYLSLARSTEAPLAIRIGVLLFVLSLLVAIYVAIVRHFRPGAERWFFAASVMIGGLTLFLLHTPFSWMRVLVFPLRSVRNPSWCEVAVLSFGICYPAALAVDALLRRLQQPRARAALAAGLCIVAILDFLPDRDTLSERQRDTDVIEQLRRAAAVLAADDEDFRVTAAEYRNLLTPISFIWHHKRIAWEFRSYKAPTRTFEYMRQVHRDLLSSEPQRAPSDAALLLGVANIKYLLDRPGYTPDLDPQAEHQLRFDSDNVRVFQNASYRPWVQLYGEYRTLLGPSPLLGMPLTTELTRNGIALVTVDGPADAALSAGSSTIYFDPKHADPEQVPIHGVPADGGLLLARRRSRVAPSFDHHARGWRTALDSIHVETDATQPTLLVVSESYHPWWTATLDGAAAPIYPGQYAFLGVPVPAGEHTVEFRFERPRTTWLWGVFNLLAIVAVVALLWRTSASGAIARSRAMF